MRVSKLEFGVIKIRKGKEKTCKELCFLKYLIFNLPIVNVFVF